MGSINLQIAYPDADGILRYRIFNNGVSRKISGNRSVIQLVAKVLLTNPGSDPLDRAAGAGLQQVVRKPVSNQTLQARQQEILVVVARCEAQIIASQTGTSLPAGERLRRVDLASQPEFVPGSRTWLIDLNVTTEDGNSERRILEA